MSFWEVLAPRKTRLCEFGPILGGVFYPTLSAAGIWPSYAPMCARVAELAVDPPPGGAVALIVLHS